MNTVLILEAEPLQRNLLTRYLTDAGLDTLEAANLVEAARLANHIEGHIHLTVIGNSDVVDFATQIAPSRKSISVLLTSHRGEDQTLLNSLPASVNCAFLQKPFFFTVLLDKIQNLVGGR